MTREERKKAIDAAVAVAAGNAFVPAAVRVGLAAMAEELAELRDRLDRVTATHRFSGVMGILQTSEEKDEN